MGAPLTVKRYMIKQWMAAAIKEADIETVLGDLGVQVPDMDTDEYKEWVDAVDYVAARL